LPSYWNFLKKMLLHEFIHILISSLVAVLIFLKFKDIRLVVAVFVVGLFIDVDHLFDYFYWARWHFSPSEFFNPSLYVNASGKVFVPLHGWEFLLPLWLGGKLIERRLNIKGLSWALSFSYFGHLLWDNLSVAPMSFGYFFIYRWLNNFSLVKFNGF